MTLMRDLHMFSPSRHNFSLFRHDILGIFTFANIPELLILDTTHGDVLNFATLDLLCCASVVCDHLSTLQHRCI